MKMMSLWKKGVSEKDAKNIFPMVGKDTISWKMIHLIGNFVTALFFGWQERGIYV